MTKDGLSERNEGGQKGFTDREVRVCMALAAILGFLLGLLW